MSNLNRSQIIKNIRENIGMCLYLQRRKKGLSLRKLSQITNIPIDTLDNAEIGQGRLLAISVKLALFYQTNIKIRLEK